MGRYVLQADAERGAAGLVVASGGRSVELADRCSWRTARLGDLYWRCGDQLKVSSGARYLARLWAWGVSRRIVAGSALRWDAALILAAAQLDDPSPLGLAARQAVPEWVLLDLLQTGCTGEVRLPEGTEAPIEGAPVAAPSGPDDSFAVPWESRFVPLFEGRGRVTVVDDLPPITGDGGRASRPRGNGILWLALGGLGVAFLAGRKGRSRG